MRNEFSDIHDLTWFKFYRKTWQFEDVDIGIMFFRIVSGDLWEEINARKKELQLYG